MTIRKHLLLSLVSILISSWGTKGQVVTSEPLFPTANDSVRIIFNAAAGNRGLAGFNGPIWAHTGLITDQSSSGTDWKYRIAEWSQETDKAKLNSLGNDLWELKVLPSIRSYYGVPSTVKILKMAFVFRNEDGSKTGRNADGSDIFQEVYQAGLNLVLLKPTTGFLVVEPLQTIPVHAATSGSDSILLFKDGVQLAKSETRELEIDLTAENDGIHAVHLVAYAGTQSVRDSFQYFIQGDDFYREMPVGVKDGINYPDDQSAILVLFAPEKDHVFVIGDFTDWKINPDFLMYKTPDQQRYWIKIENLNPGQEYMFQYLVDGELLIADPYSNKISDPWNDQYIGSTVYPGLKPYPTGKTTQIASVLQTSKVAYEWKVQNFKPADPEKLIIYELLMRDFTKCHTFSCIMDTLNYLKSLGINAIELMPVSEFEGNDSWGYNPSFYFAADKYYGPENDLKEFIDTCHEMGIAVILDMVLNHSYGQSPLVRLYWDPQNNCPAANNPWYNAQSPNSDYSWGYDFNHESEYTQKFVDSVNAFWLREFKFDGFRFDFTKGFTNTPGDGGAYDASRIRLLKRMYDQIREVNPDVYVILEHFADNREEKELSNYGMMIWGNSNYNYRKATSSYFLDGKSDFSWISWQKRGWTEPHLVGYMESHDEERLMYECYYWGNTSNPEYKIKDTTIALQRMELDANFFIPVPGPKMIWMFGELGYDYSINYNGRVGVKPIRWDYLNDYRRLRVYQVYSALNALKQQYPVFGTSSYSLAFADTVKRINLSDASMNVTIIGNYGTRSSKADPNFQHTGWWYEYWSGDSLNVTDVHARFVLQPGEYRLYTDSRLKKPDIITGTGPIILNGNELSFNIYPNPANRTVYFNTGSIQSGYRIRLLDLHGRVLYLNECKDPAMGQTVEIDLDGASPGIYLVEMVAGGRRGIKKLVIN